jgi:hypothetical protein
LAVCDLKLRACLRAFDGVEQLLTLATADLQDVANAYQRNLNRVHRLILFAPASVQVAINMQRAVDKVHKMRPRPRGQAFKDAVKTVLRRDEKTIEAASRVRRETFTNNMETITFEILEMLSDDDPSGHEAWLAAQMSATWTAFEAMAGDLWEAALNCRPEELAKLAGKKHDAESKMISLDYIQKYKFDLSKHMGTIFASKYKFDSLQGIRGAYKDAFGSYIDNIIDDTALDALSVVRNNLVHSGGLIDDKYRRRAAVLPPEAMDNIGSPIPLEGRVLTPNPPRQRRFRDPRLAYRRCRVVPDHSQASA